MAVDLEKRRASKRAWVKAHPEYHREYMLRSRVANPGKEREQLRRWRAAHPEAVREQGARQRQRNKEAILVSAAAWRAAHRAESLAYTAAWQAANREKVRANVSRRRARLLGAAGSHTVAEWLALCVEHDWACAYCGVIGPLARDHVVPLTFGGSDFIDNIKPACHSCNASKGNRPLAEWSMRFR